MALGAMKEEVEIIKPRNDKREYRRIVLPNNLVVLLISDAETDKVSDLRLIDFNVYPFIEISICLMRNFSYFVLNTVFLDSMYFLLQCSASMDVCVGSFSDPEGLEGLAHFLGEQVFCLQMF